MPFHERYVAHKIAFARYCPAEVTDTQRRCSIPLPALRHAFTFCKRRCAFWRRRQFTAHAAVPSLPPSHNRRMPVAAAVHHVAFCRPFVRYAFMLFFVAERYAATLLFVAALAR